MEPMTLAQVVKAAPGAAHRRDAKKERLLDTYDFLTSLGPRYRPVMAMQGTAHSDGKVSPADGRHLVVASRDDGICIALLNSHDRLQRVWVGMGLWNGEELLLGPTISVQRWRGVDEALSQFVNDDAEKGLKAGRANLSKRAKEVVGIPYSHRLAAYVSFHGYPKNRSGAPSHEGLVNSAEDSSADGIGGLPPLDVAFALVKAARVGNLYRPEGRNVKGIRSPDAYWHLVQATLNGALALL